MGAIFATCGAAELHRSLLPTTASNTDEARPPGSSRAAAAEPISLQIEEPQGIIGPYFHRHF